MGKTKRSLWMQDAQNCAFYLHRYFSDFDSKMYEIWGKKWIFSKSVWNYPWINPWIYPDLSKMDLSIFTTLLLDYQVSASAHHTDDTNRQTNWAGRRREDDWFCRKTPTLNGKLAPRFQRANREIPWKRGLANRRSIGRLAKRGKLISWHRCVLFFFGSRRNHRCDHTSGPIASRRFQRDDVKRGFVYAGIFCIENA